MAKLVKLFAFTAVLALAADAWAESSAQNLPDFDLPSPQQVTMRRMPSTAAAPLDQTPAQPRDVQSFTGNYHHPSNSDLEDTGVRKNAEDMALDQCFRFLDLKESLLNGCVVESSLQCDPETSSRPRLCNATATASIVRGTHWAGDGMGYQGFATFDFKLITDKLAGDGAEWMALQNALHTCKAANNLYCVLNSSYHSSHWCDVQKQTCVARAIFIYGINP